MALLPPTYLATLVFVFILVRLRRIFSISTLLLQDVAFYVPPDKSILDGLNTPEAKKSKYQKPEKTPGERIQHMQLGMSPIGSTTLSKCLFSDLYDGLVIIVFTAVISTALMNVAPSSLPDPSYYLQVGAFLVSLLFPFFIQYGMSSYESQLGLGVALLATILALFSLYAPPGLLDIDIEGASASMDQRWAVVLDSLGFPRVPSTFTTLWVSILLGVLAGLISSTTLLPAFRFARMYSDFVGSKAISTPWKFVLRLNIALPLLLTMSWIRPLTNSFIVGPNATPCSTSNVNFPWLVPRDCGELRFGITESMWRNIRLNLLVIAALVRLACFRSHIQYFLLEPKHKVTAQLLVKGRVDIRALVDTLVIPFNYLPVICVQYLTPVAMWLVSALLLRQKTDRCFGWMDIMSYLGLGPLPGLECQAHPPLPTVLNHVYKPGHDWTQWIKFIQELQSFPFAEPLWFESILGFLVWWIAASWCILTAVGVVYWRQVEGLQQTWTKQTKLD